MKVIIITHEHRHGTDTHPVTCEGEFDLDAAIEELGIDYEADRADESIDWDEMEVTPLKQQGLPKQKVHVTPYDEEMGVFWKLMFGDETVEDGFESTADAEDWAREKGYIPLSCEPEEYSVDVCRIGYAHKTITVMARCEEEAIDKADEEAGGEEFSESSSEYEFPNGATRR